MRASSNTILDTDNAVLELLLRNTKVLVGVCQMLDLLIELLLDLRELLHAERIQVDYVETSISTMILGDYRYCSMAIRRMYYLTLVSFAAVGHL